MSDIFLFTRIWTKNWRLFGGAVYKRWVRLLLFTGWDKGGSKGLIMISVHVNDSHKWPWQSKQKARQVHNFVYLITSTCLVRKMLSLAVAVNYLVFPSARYHLVEEGGLAPSLYCLKWLLKLWLLFIFTLPAVGELVLRCHVVESSLLIKCLRIEHHESEPLN